MAKRKRKSKPAAKIRTPPADRAKILAEMKSSGMTAVQAAEKHGLSPWTIYGWRKPSRARAAKRTARRATGGKRAGRAAAGRSAGSLAEMLRPVIARIVREEMARLVGR